MYRGRRINSRCGTWYIPTLLWAKYLFICPSLWPGCFNSGLSRSPQISHWDGCAASAPFDHTSHPLPSWIPSRRTGTKPALAGPRSICTPVRNIWGHNSSTADQIATGPPRTGNCDFWPACATLAGLEFTEGSCYQHPHAMTEYAVGSSGRTSSSEEQGGGNYLRLVHYSATRRRTRHFEN
jgi:hypothetical protein